MTTRDHIIQLAKECGFVGQELDRFSNTIPAFYLAAQREAYEKAAQVCETHYNNRGYVREAEDFAEDIRKLKEESCKS